MRIKVRLTAVYHREVAEGRFAPVPFRPSAYACERAAEERDALLRAGCAVEAPHAPRGMGS